MLITRAISIGIVFLLALCSIGFGQDKALHAREIFIKSRVTAGPEANAGNGPVTGDPSASAKGPAKARRRQVLGFGYNFYLNTDKDSPDGKYIHVDPGVQTFKSGDQIRLVVEASADGYLYIFNQTNDERPVMIFPNYNTFNGDNRVKAHRQYMVPGDNVIEFDENTGTENMTIVLSRHPIPYLPVRQQLRSQPKYEIAITALDRITRSAPQAESKQIENEQPVGAKVLGLGERGIEIKTTTPPPDNILITVSKTQSLLAARVALKHR